MTRLEVGLLLLSNCFHPCLFKDILSCLVGDCGTLDLLKPSGNLESCFCFSRPKKMSCIVNVIGESLVGQPLEDFGVEVQHVN